MSNLMVAKSPDGQHLCAYFIWRSRFHQTSLPSSPSPICIRGDESVENTTDCLLAKQSKAKFDEMADGEKAGDKLIL
jgi:hypothetical protein